MLVVIIGVLSDVAFLTTGLSVNIINRTGKYIDFSFLLFYNCAKPHQSVVPKCLHTQTLGSYVLMVLRGREKSVFPDNDAQVTVLRVMTLHFGLRLTRC